jgi:hypothetical protein
MAELLYELDSGASCLPPGSEIVFVNVHPPEDTLGALLRGKTLTNVKVGELLMCGPWYHMCDAASNALLRGKTLTNVKVCDFVPFDVRYKRGTGVYSFNIPWRRRCTLTTIGMSCCVWEEPVLVAQHAHGVHCPCTECALRALSVS